MKKTIIVLIEIAILLVVLRSSFAQYVLQDMQRTVSGWFSYVAQTQERNQLEAVRNVLLQGPNELNEHQRAYLHKITADQEALRHFYGLYCRTDDINPYIYGAARFTLCRKIDQTPELL